MSSWHANAEDDVSPTRLLARSLLYEALALPPQTPGVPDLRRKHAGRYLAYWTAPRVRDALVCFLTQYERPPTSQEWRHARAYGLPNVSTLTRLLSSTKAGAPAWPPTCPDTSATRDWA